MMNRTDSKIFITNLGKYNEGELCGEWANLPITDYELEDVLYNIGIDGVEYEEYFITDFEGEFLELLGVNEYTNIRKLSEKIEELESLTDDELMYVKGYLEVMDNDLENAIRSSYDGYVIHDIKNEYDLGYYMIHESGIYNEDDLGTLSNYIDYERFGRDLTFDNYVITGDGYAIYIE